MPQSFLQVAADGVGKKLRSLQRTVGANLVEEQYVVVNSSRQRRGLYRAHTGAHLITAAADAATGGRWFLINPVGSAIAIAVKRVSFSSQHGTVLATPTSPRITLERFSFTGTTTAGAIVPALRVRTAIADQTLDAAPLGSVRTANTGLAMTGGEVYKAFLPVVALTAVGAAPPSVDDYDPASEDMELILAPGEGILCRQADAGTTADTRRFITTVTWEEFTAAV